MLSRKNRLSKQKDFEEIFKTGRRQKIPGLTIFFRFNEEKNLRLAVVVSGKSAKKAVDRNRFRRRSKEAIKKEKEMLKKGLDLILIAGPTAVHWSYGQIEKAIISLFKKADLYVSKSDFGDH